MIFTKLVALIKLIAGIPSKLLLRYLSAECSSCAAPTHSFEILHQTIRPLDVLLVEGQHRYSTAIKYLTQSNWSHAAIYIGGGLLVEAELEFGVIESPLEKYRQFHTRILHSAPPDCVPA